MDKFSSGLPRRVHGGLGPACVVLVISVLVLTPPSPARAQMPPTRPQASSVPRPPRPPPPYRQGYVGLTLTTNSAGWGQVLRRSDAAGALVVMVLPDSPAQQAGLAPGDVIVAIDDQPVRNERRAGTLLRIASTLANRLTVVGPGGIVRTVEVTVGSQPGVPFNDLMQEQVAADPSAANRLIYAQTGADPETALAILDDLRGLFPAFGEVHAARAERLLALAVGRQDQAPETATAITDAIKRAIDIDPRSMSVQLSAAQVFGTLLDAAQAARHAENAIALDDSSASAHQLLGLARHDMDQPAEALPELRRAVQLAPHTGEHYRNLSRCYRALGRIGFADETDRALDALNRVESQRGTSVAPGEPLTVGLAASAAMLLGVALPLRRRRTSEQPGPIAARVHAMSPPGRAALETLGAAALFSLAVPPLGRALALSPGSTLVTEVVDHVVPGVLILILCALAVRILHRAAPSADFFYVMAMLVGLAGLWMTATHIPLLLDAAQGDVLIEVAVFHSLAGLIILAIAVLLWRSPPSHVAQVAGRRKTTKPRRHPSTSDHRRR